MSADLLSSAFATFVGQRRATCASNVSLPHDALVSSYPQPFMPAASASLPLHSAMHSPTVNDAYVLPMHAANPSITPMPLPPSSTNKSCVNRYSDAPPPLKRLRTYPVSSCDSHVEPQQHQAVVSPVSIFPPPLSLPRYLDSTFTTTAAPSKTTGIVSTNNPSDRKQASSLVDCPAIVDNRSQVVDQCGALPLKRKFPSPLSSPSSLQMGYTQPHALTVPTVETVATPRPFSPVSTIVPVSTTIATPVPLSTAPPSLCIADGKRPTQMSPISSTSSPLSHPLPMSLPPLPPPSSTNLSMSPQQHQQVPKSSQQVALFSSNTGTDASPKSPEQDEGYSVLSSGKSESVSSSSWAMMMMMNKKSVKEEGKKTKAGRLGGAQLTCNVCKGKFENEQVLREHKRGHGRPFACIRPGCSASFSKANHLSRHVRIVHNKERPFACDEEGCGARFGSKSHLGDHTRAVHMRLRTFKCHMCDASWSKRFNLEKHIRIRHYGEKPFRCTLCRMSFGTRSHVTRHEIKVHKKHSALQQTPDEDA